MSQARSVDPGRMQLIEAMRALASTVIAWHHLCLYWPPMSGQVAWVTEVVRWISENGRATQLFFVIGGFVMAQSMSRRRWDGAVLRRYAVQRYLRLALPYLAAMMLALAACAVGRELLPEYLTGGTPATMQILAHLVFLQKILGYESFSAGMWFVCINFQLSLLFALGLWCRDTLPPGLRWLPMAAGWGLAASCLFYFNVDDRWDMWALYFFAHFFTGVMAWYGLRSRRWAAAFWAYLLLSAMALTWRCGLDDWQFALPTVRMLVALAVGMVLHLGALSGLGVQWPRGATVTYLGHTAYSLFLVHFPVLVLVLCVWTWLGWLTPMGHVAGLLSTYALSLLAANLFYRYVETPAARVSREFA
ncbi:MAG: acyltransferase [Gammaproteobacteria bacterium]|jgi:peptidoglycan/LPS O-acetylase OafA/YrhL|nr:acyltransferase [Gammaproteobacteria bacterium]